MPSEQTLFVVIVGCGRLGSYLANKLSSAGHSVVVIDIDESTFDALSAEYSGFQVVGDATEFAILKQAKTDKADLVIAATSEDNINLMVAQIAKRIFRVPRVVSIVFDPKRAEIYRDLGIETNCPIKITGELFIESLMKSSLAEEGSR